MGKRKLASIQYVHHGKYDSGHHKEGIVIRPVIPVYSPTIEEPLSMKVLNNDYLLKE